MISVFFYTFHENMNLIILQYNSTNFIWIGRLSCYWILIFFANYIFYNEIFFEIYLSTQHYSMTFFLIIAIVSRSLLNDYSFRWLVYVYIIV